MSDSSSDFEIDTSKYKTEYGLLVINPNHPYVRHPDFRDIYSNYCNLKQWLKIEHLCDAPCFKNIDADEPIDVDAEDDSNSDLEYLQESISSQESQQGGHEHS